MLVLRPETKKMVPDSCASIPEITQTEARFLISPAFLLFSTFVKNQYELKLNRKYKSFKNSGNIISNQPHILKVITILLTKTKLPSMRMTIKQVHKATTHRIDQFLDLLLFYILLKQ